MIADQNVIDKVLSHLWLPTTLSEAEVATSVQASDIARRWPRCEPTWLWVGCGPRV